MNHEPHDHWHAHAVDHRGHAHAPMRHEHSHGAHAHAPRRDYGTAFLIGIALNVAIIVVEVTYGIVAHSMSLIADAGHNLSDVLGLGISWAATIMVRLRPSTRRTYGFRRISILAALANAVLLFVATGAVAWESIKRLFSPGTVEGGTMIAVAFAAVVVNGVSALLFMSGRKGDLNVRSAFLHLAGDALLALGVALTGLVILATGWFLLDPIVSLVLSLLILGSTWSLLRGSIDLMLDAVPAGIEPAEVRAYLAALPGVTEVHDLHIWAMSTTETALTAHLVMNGSCESAFLGRVCAQLHDRFRIEHSTLQVEPGDAPDPCRLAPDESL